MGSNEKYDATHIGTEYTPSLEIARESYGYICHDSYIESNRKIKELEFDRVIDKVRAEAKAEALEETAKVFNIEAVSFQPSWGSNEFDKGKIDGLCQAEDWLRGRAKEHRNGSI